MRTLRRIALSFVPATFAALVLFVPTAAPVPSGAGLQNVNLACSDGTNLALALDTAAVTQLTGAVTAINLFPAGDPVLACSVSQSTGLSLSGSFSDGVYAASGNPNKSYAVGGGRAALFICIGPAETNFALNARVDAASNGLAGTGTFNITIPQSECEFGQGHWNGKVDCVLVSSPNEAQATFLVTKDQGSLTGFAGEELRVDVYDSGLPGGLGDRLSLTSPQGPCDFSGYFAQNPVDNGNISVHQATP